MQAIDYGKAVGGGIGTIAGVVVGESIGGRHGAIIGTVVGAAFGESLDHDLRHYGNARAGDHRHRTAPFVVHYRYDDERPGSHGRGWGPNKHRYGHRHGHARAYRDWGRWPGG